MNLVGLVDHLSRETARTDLDVANPADYERQATVTIRSADELLPHRSGV